MEVILTHEQADFDAAGSVLAAWLDDPSRVPILPKKRNRNLAAFMEDYRSRLPFFTWHTVPRGSITRVYVTDTQVYASHQRIADVRDVIVWDHHPHRHLIPDREENIYDPTGACTTFLVEKLSQKKDAHPGRIFSTLMLMGIYEDTGFLSYGSTTSRDIRAAAWLLDHGADLDLLRRYVLQPLTDNQQMASDLLLKNCRTYTIRGKQIMIAAADVRDVSDEYSAVAHHLRDILCPDGLVIILAAKTGIRLIGRTTTDTIDIGKLMEAYNGGGHARAASALIPLEDPENEDIPELLETLRGRIAEQLADHIEEPCIDLSRKLEEKIPAEGMDLIRQVSETAEGADMPVYIVGGTVRDILLDRPVMDFDIVTEGDSIQLGKKLVAAYGGKLTVHPAFFTAKWELPDGTALDLISARSETYDHPAALPTVKMSDIRNDLKRRDFTLNTLAVRLDRPHCGELLDVCGGLRDLERREIRTLHAESFVDDPTRMFRAVRFEQRFDFTLEPDTLRQLREQLSGIASLTGQRIWHELKLYCKEPYPEDDLARIVQLGIAGQIHGGLTWPEDLESEFVRYRSEGPEDFWNTVPAAELDPVSEEGLLWIWLSSFPEKMIDELSERLLLSGKTHRAVICLARLRNEMPLMADKNPSEVCFFLDTILPASLYCYWRICCDEGERSLIRSYIGKWRTVMPLSSGDDLMRMGIPAGPEIRKTLIDLRCAWLDGEIRSREDELNRISSVIRNKL